MATKKTIQIESARLIKEIAPLEERKRELEKQMFAILEQAKQSA